MANITMETDWGAKGAQLTGSQVQTFIKDELKKLIAKDAELQQKIDALGPTPEAQALQTEINNVKKQITDLTKQLESSTVASDWIETDKTSKSYIKNKPEIQTVTTIPDENLKSYTNQDGTVINFKVGDFVRYKDVEGNYQFYQINDISEAGVVTWKPAGSGNGGSTDVRETVCINLTSNQAQPDTALNGATITVKGTDQTVYYTGTWAGQTLYAKVPAMAEYTISVSEVASYATPAVLKFTAAIQGRRDVSLMYNCCILTVNITGIAETTGTYATVSYGSVSNNVEHGKTIKVPFGTQVTVSCPEKVNYAKPSNHVFTPSQASQSVTMTYNASMFHLKIDSNQADKSDIGNVTATLKYDTYTYQVSNGQSVPVPVGTLVTVSFPELQGYLKPDNITFTNTTGNIVSKTVYYRTELVTVNVNADNGQSMNGQIVTVNNVQHTWKGTPIVQKVPFNTAYKVSANLKDQYVTPQEQSFTANQPTRNVNMQYVYSPMQMGYYIIDDSVDDPATKITQTPDGEKIIKWIRDNSHRVLVKKITNGSVKVIKLLDTDGTKFFDGTPAPITSDKYDVMMQMPDFWYKASSGSDGLKRTRIYFADKDPALYGDSETWKKWDHNSLIGVYEASITHDLDGTKLAHSISGTNSVYDMQYSDAKIVCESRGTGYHPVTWQAHTVMAYLFFGYYKTTHSQKACGYGSISHTYGELDHLGMKDTVYIHGTFLEKNINFWGLENWWSGRSEIIGDAYIEKNIHSKYYFKAPGHYFYVSGKVLGTPNIFDHENLRLISNDQNIRQAYEEGYTDHQYYDLTQTQADKLYCLRSGNGGTHDNGITYLYFDNMNNNKDDTSTRLCFTGNVEETTYTDEFK